MKNFFLFFPFLTFILYSVSIESLKLEDSQILSSGLNSIPDFNLPYNKYEFPYHLKSIDYLSINDGIYLTELANNSLIVYNKIKIKIEDDEEKCTTQDTCYWVYLVLSICTIISLCFIRRIDVWIKCGLSIYR